MSRFLDKTKVLSTCVYIYIWFYIDIYIYRERFIPIYMNAICCNNDPKKLAVVQFCFKIYRPDIQEFSSLYSLIYSSRGESSKMAFQSNI